jgi:hypothetical protein
MTQQFYFKQVPKRIESRTSKKYLFTQVHRKLFTIAESQFIDRVSRMGATGLRRACMRSYCLMSSKLQSSKMKKLEISCTM